MPFSFREITAPIAEPLSLSLAKQHLRVYFTDDDIYIQALIAAARQYVEKYTNRAILNRRMQLNLDYFPLPRWHERSAHAFQRGYPWYLQGLLIRLPMPRTVSVESITYLSDVGMDPITIDPSNYTVDVTSEPARISPVPGYTWPYQSNYIPGQVQVIFVAGSYEETVIESVVVADDGTYTLSRASQLLAVNSVTTADGEATPVSYVNDAGTLRFDLSLAGQNLQASYEISNTPQTIIFAMLLLIKHWYTHRDSTSELNLKDVPTGVQALLAGEVIESFDW